MATHNEDIDGAEIQRSVGFTLIELLVVLVIIGLLAALMFPVLASARRSTRMTACSSNLRQIDLALRMYQEDWNGDLPLEPFVDTWMFQQWPNDPLKPYTKSGAIYHCPDADTSHGTLASDYWMRSALLPEAKDKKRIRPEPRTVLVYCDNHIRRRDFTPDAGEYLVLRADASVSRVPAAAVVKWLYLNGRWIAPGEGSDRILGASIWPVFPQEPWPPEFVQ